MFKGSFVAYSQQSVANCYVTPNSGSTIATAACSSPTTLGGGSTYNYCAVSMFRISNILFNIEVWSDSSYGFLGKKKLEDFLPRKKR